MEQLLFYLEPIENTDMKEHRANTIPLTESQKKFYSERYLRRKVQKFFEVNIRRKIIYVDTDVTLTKTRQRQVKNLVDNHKYQLKPTPQTKIFNK